jgi:hypothetical protein
VFNAMMDGVGEALMRAAGGVLAPGAAAGLAPDGPLDELGQRLADTMAAFGASHLSALATPDKRTLFLQQARGARAGPCTHGRERPGDEGGSGRGVLLVPCGAAWARSS